MKHSFLQSLSTTFSSKSEKYHLAIFVMLTGSPTFGQARRGTTQKPIQQLSLSQAQIW